MKFLSVGMKTKEMIVSRTGSSQAAGSKKKIETEQLIVQLIISGSNISGVSPFVNVVKSTLTYIVYFMFLTCCPTIRGH